MQIADGFDAILASLELAHDAVLHAIAAERDLVAGVGDLVCNLETLDQHQRAIGGGEFRPGRRLSACDRRARTLRNRLDVAHRVAKQLAVGITAFAAQATSALMH